MAQKCVLFFFSSFLLILKFVSTVTDAVFYVFIYLYATKPYLIGAA